MGSPIFQTELSAPNGFFPLRHHAADAWQINFAVGSTPGSQKMIRDGQDLAMNSMGCFMGDRYIIIYAYITLYNQNQVTNLYIYTYALLMYGVGDGDEEDDNDDASRDGDGGMWWQGWRWPWQFTQLQVQMDYLDSEQFPNIASTNPRSTKKSRWYLQHIHCHLHSAAVRGQSGHARRRCQPPTFGWFCHVWSKLGHRKNITTKCSEQDCYLQKDDVVVFKLASKRAKDIDQHCRAGRLQMCQCQEGLHETCLVGCLTP